MSETIFLSLSLLTTMASMVLPSLMLASGHERRRLAWIGAIAIVGYSATANLFYPAGLEMVDLTNPGATIGGTILAFGIYMVAVPAATLMVFRMPLWDALFCSAMGYTMQNMASSLGEATLLFMFPLGRAGATPIASLVVNLVWYVLVYGACYLLFIRHMIAASELSPSRNVLFAMLLVLFLVIFFDMQLKSLALEGASVPRVLALRAVHVATCLLVLLATYELVYRQQLRHEIELERALRAEEEKRWELSRENVDAINIKCHDIRHQIRTLTSGNAAVDQAVLDDIAREVEVYDSLVRTGNAALDTILSEKRLVCDRDGIELTVIADGEALASLAPAELYALVGNALDNAIEATRQVSDPEERSVGVIVRRAAGMTSLHVENSFAGPAPELRDGLPQTTKGDTANHGFGMRSMRSIAERHGGTLSVTAHGNTFELDILLGET